jgi:hypothetical protein
MAEVAWSGRLLEVVRTTRGYVSFFLCSVTGELLALQVAGPRPGGYMDASTTGPG